MQVNPIFFPALNAFLNGTSAVLIGTGLYFIRSGRVQAHKRMMLSAFVTSCLFLDFLPLLPPGIARRGYALPRTGNLATNLLHHPDLTHNSGGSGCAVYPGNAGTRAERALPAAQGHRSVHFRHLDVCVDYRAW